MAKLCMPRRNEKRLANFKKWAPKRDAARLVMQDPEASFEDKLEAQKYLQATRDGSAARLRRICAITGRPRGSYRRFGMSRTKIREFAMNSCDVPGLTKSSW
jgi:small subunit ribosomal protein S14